MVKIRLKKFGTKKRPDYRIVIQDARKPRDGETVEEIGQYHTIAAENSQV
ncbi:MAG: 30S ribosomal protein S16, partial [Treponema sp.]|nr:30S ribosomal protein S16 [Treponema sp.]